VTLEEAQKINAAVKAGRHVFKYDRPMDPTPTMKILEALVDEETEFVDITEGGGPNESMKTVSALTDALGGIERAIFGLRMIHAAAKQYGSEWMETAARHALAALGECP
jgi:hypothetical protein